MPQGRSGLTPTTFAPARLTAACRNEGDEQIFGGRDKLAQRRRAPFASPRGTRIDRDWWNVNERNQRTPVSRPFQSAPIGIVAEVAPGIARESRLYCAAANRSQQTHERRRTAHRGRSAWRDNAALRAIAARVGKEDQEGVARARFNAKVTSAPGKTEHQHNVRRIGEKRWQITVDGGVIRFKHVCRADDLGERGPSSADKRRD